MRVLLGWAALMFMGYAALAGGFGGEWGLGLELLPDLAADTHLRLDYALGDQVISSFSQFSWGTWVWQEFSGEGALGPLGWEGNVLFGPSTVEFLYDELILRLDFAGLGFAFYAAQLSGAVLGGPADGAALEVLWDFDGIGIKSTTEFGARPDGIEIFHAATGLSRRYTTDPRLPGNGLTGELLEVKGIPFCCGLSGDIELYLRKDVGFDHLGFSLEGLRVWCCPPIYIEPEVTFELQTKSVTLEPAVEAPGGCFTPSLSLLTDWQGLDPKIEGIVLNGFTLECDLGPVKLKDVTVLDRCHYAISTPEYGTELVERSKADEEGIEYFTEYWEAFSLETRGPGCCGGEWRLILNTYFGDPGALFGWGMSYIRLQVPWNKGISSSLTLRLSPSGVEELRIETSLSW